MLSPHSFCALCRSGNSSLFSTENASHICCIDRCCVKHFTRRAVSFDLPNAGINIEMSNVINEMTTSISISEKPVDLEF